MGPRFGLGQRVRWTGGLRGTVSSVFLSAAHAWMAQIARPRLRLRATLGAPRALPRPRVGRPYPCPEFHDCIVFPGGREGAFVAESALAALSARPAPTRFRLGSSATAPWGFAGVVMSVHRGVRATVLAGLVGPGWFAAQLRRPASRRQPFYGLTGDRGAGSVLAGEAELRRFRSRV